MAKILIGGKKLNITRISVELCNEDIDGLRRQVDALEDVLFDAQGKPISFSMVECGYGGMLTQTVTFGFLPK